MEIRATTEQDLPVFLDVVHTAFGRFTETPVDGGGLWWSAIEMDRGLLAFTAEGRPVGSAAAYSFELTLPGGVIVPAAGVSAVGVLPSHRRQGVLSAMMRHQLLELRDRGESLAVLLASEAAIYQRFGYGPATETAHLTVPRHRAAFGHPRASATSAASATETRCGSIEVVAREGCGQILEEVYDRYRRAQPGALGRPHRWWILGAGAPPVTPTPRYVAVHRDADGVPDGYASYSLDSGTLEVDDPFLGEHHRYLLTVQDGKADCVPTEREPDLSLDVSDLGSVYLGGTAPSTLVRAGHIHAHHEGAASLADAVFRVDRSPHRLHWF